jgi:cytosine/adenosine deaminase-related metal-dependent hydrolase
MAAKVYSAPWVLLGRFPGARSDGAIADGAVALEGDRLLAAGPRADVEARHGKGERLDAVILPGLVNAHLHLELSHLAGRVAGGEGLAAWIQLFIAARAASDEEAAAPQAMIMGAEDLVRAGVAAVGDVSNTLASVEPLATARIAGTVFHEVFGFTPHRIEAALAVAREAREGVVEPPGLRIVLSPHAVYSTELHTIEVLLRAGPGSIHLAEDPEERVLCATGKGGFGRMLASMEARALRPTARSAVAAVAPFLAPHHLAVHCVDVDDEDIALLARSGATVVLCPRSNRFIVGRLPPLPKLLAAGVPLAVGTDSLASSPSLGPLAELAVLRRAFPDVPARTLLPLAWNGAAVGAPHVGALVPGRAPGVLAATLERPVADPFEHLVASGAEARQLTWLSRQAPPEVVP